MLGRLGRVSSGIRLGKVVPDKIHALHLDSVVDIKENREFIAGVLLWSNILALWHFSMELRQ